MTTSSASRFRGRFHNLPCSPVVRHRRPRPASVAGLHVKHLGQGLNTARAQSTGRRRGGQDAPDNRRCEDRKKRRPARGASVPRRGTETPLRTREKRRGRAQGLGPMPPPRRTPLSEGLTEASTLGRSRTDGPHAWRGDRWTRERPVHGGERPVPASGNGAPHCPVSMVRHRVRGREARGPHPLGGGGRRRPAPAGAHRPSDRPCTARGPAGRHGRPGDPVVRAEEVGGARRPGTSRSGAFPRKTPDRAGDRPPRLPLWSAIGRWRAEGPRTDAIEGAC